MPSQRFEPIVGSHVVGLARVAEQGGGRGEHHEEVQRQLTGQLMQVLRALGFGLQHALQLFGIKVANQTVVDHCRRMHQAT